MSQSARSGRRSSEGASLGGVGVAVGDRLQRVVDDPNQQVIDQVLAYRQIGDGRDAQPFKLGRRADPREKQEARRIECSGREDHLTRADRLLRAIVALDDYTLSAGAVHREPEHASVSLQMQIRSIQDRRDERAVGVETLAIGDRRLVPAGAVQGAAVERRVIRESRPGSPLRPSPRSRRCGDPGPPDGATLRARRTPSALNANPSRSTPRRPSGRNPT